MAPTYLLWSCLLAAAAVGPYSGVDLNDLLATPMLATTDIYSVSGAALAQHGQGMTVGQFQGRSVVVTGQDFNYTFTADVASGRYLLLVNAVAQNRGDDSYWVEVDGKRLRQPLALSLGALAERHALLSFAQPGEHTFRLLLREAPGSVLESVRLARMQVKSPRPALRPELIGQHPRLLLTAADLPALRARLSDPRVQKFYRLPSVLTRKPPPYRKGARNGGAFRDLGSYAFEYLLSTASGRPDKQQLAAVSTWLEAATKYGDVGVDLDAEYFLEGVALSYDWAYNGLSPDLRQRVRDTIAEKCRRLYQASLEGRTGGGLSFQQNHFWYAHLALALGAAAVYGEVPEAKDWLAWAWDRYERIALTFSPDGGYHEGVGYWDYSMPTLYLYTDLYEWCTGLHAPSLDQGLAGEAEYRFRLLYPGLKESAPLEDTKVSQGRPPIKLLLWTAKRFHDPVAAGMADLLNTGPSTDRFNLLWLDEKVPSRDPRQVLKPTKYYPDIETLLARTSWDDDATFAAFVCRPMGGHKYADLCAKYGLGGTGHNHPEEGHFILFGRGQTLAADPGYTYDKRTRNHNTILVDGQGQYGDGEMWPRPNPGRAHITRFTSQGDITIVTGDATSAYPPALGLKRFERTFVLAGRNLAVVYDRLADNQPRTFSWLLHHYGTIQPHANAWTITRGQAQLTVAPLMPAQITAATSTYRPQYIHPTRNLTPRHADINLLELKTAPTREATFLVPLIIGDAGSPAPTPELLQVQGADAVQVGNTVVIFNRGQGEIRARLPWGGEIVSHAAVIVARQRGGKTQQVACR